MPSINVAIYGDVPERTMLRIAKNLRDDLKTIPSVLQADLSGARDEMLEIQIDPAKLESYGISQQEMFAAVSNNNRLIPAGSIDTVSDRRRQSRASVTASESERGPRSKSTTK